MIHPELRQKIRRLYYAEHWKVGTIASQLGLHHETVRRAIERASSSAPPRIGKSALDPFVPLVRQTLERYPRLRATRIHEMLVERGYGGSVIQTRRLVRRLRPRPKEEAFFRLSVLPGEQAQVDWASFGTIQVGRAERRLSAFVMVLSWSRALHALFALDQQLESFLRGHVEAYAYFGGAPRTIWLDNLKSAVLQRTGDRIEFHPRYLELCGHYHTNPRPVGIGRGSDKGRVERQIRFLRDRFFAARSFKDVDDLNRQFETWREKWAHARPCPGDPDISVAEALAIERERLLALPAHPLETDRIVTIRSGKTPYLRFDRNDYSIPHRLIREPLTLCASPTEIRILDADQEVARHVRSYDKGRRIEDPAHLDGLADAKRKARLRRGRTPLVDAVPVAQAMLEEMMSRGEHIGTATRQLLVLLDLYGPDELAAAITEALDRGTASTSSVAHLLEVARRRRNIPPPIHTKLPNRPEIRDLRIPSHDLEPYDALAQNKDDDEPQRAR